MGNDAKGIDCLLVQKTEKGRKKKKDATKKGQIVSDEEPRGATNALNGAQRGLEWTGN